MRGADWRDVDAIAVTQGPGLVGSLLVGVSFAKAAAWARGKPLVAVNHLAGHIESLWLEHGDLPMPAVVLVVSGGHTSLYLVPRAGRYQLLGRTRDDAAGEAYDKVAKLLGLGYPGGPIIDRLRATGNDDGDALAGDAADASPIATRPQRDGRFDFSFSGLKTAVLRHVRAAAGRAWRRATLPDAEIADIVRKLPARRGRHAGRSHVRRGALARRAQRRHRRRRLGQLAGCARSAARAAQRGEMPVFVPSLALSTDNAAMIAAAGMRQLARRIAPRISMRPHRCRCDGRWRRTPVTDTNRCRQP